MPPAAAGVRRRGGGGSRSGAVVARGVRGLRHGGFRWSCGRGHC